ncbi:MAG: hypothetical protein ACRAS9_01845 [Mycoplasma sp.]
MMQIINNLLKVKTKLKMTKFGLVGSLMVLVMGIELFRFPDLIAKYGVVFFIPFIVGIVFITIPMVILETNIGKREQSSITTAFKRIANRFEILGWIQTLTSWLIGIYLVGVVGWAVIGFINSFDSNNFISKTSYFNIATNSDTINNISEFAIFAVLGVIVLTFLFALIGMRKGLQWIGTLFAFLLFGVTVLLIAFLFIQHGSINGVDYFFTSKWDNLTKFDIWQDAFSQSLLTFILGTGAITSFSKFSNQNQDVNCTSVIISLFAIFFGLLSSLLFALVVGHTAGELGINSISTYLNKAYNPQNGPIWFYLLPDMIASLHKVSIIAIGIIVSLIVALVFVISFIFHGVLDNLREKFQSKRIISYLVFLLLTFGLSTFFATNLVIILMYEINFWIICNLLLILVIFQNIFLIYIFRKLKYFLLFGNIRSVFRTGPIIEISLALFLIAGIIFVWISNLTTNFTADMGSLQLNIFLISIAITIGAIGLSIIAYSLMKYFLTKTPFWVAMILLLIIPIVVLIALTVYIFNLHSDVVITNSIIEHIVLIGILMFVFLLAIALSSIPTQHTVPKVINK